MEDKIKEQIKELFSEIKELAKKRKKMSNDLQKGSCDEISLYILPLDSDIKARLFSITILIKILLKNEKIWDIHLGDLGSKHIYLSYATKGCCKIHGIKYKV